MRRYFLLPILVIILASCRSTEPGQVDFAWSGAVTDSSFAIVFMPLSAGHFEIQVRNGSELVLEERVETSDVLAPIRIDIPGLAPSTDYVWTVNGAEGKAMTFASGAFSYNVAVGSCAESGSESPLFEQIAAREPLFYLQTGDFHYGDIESDCETAFPETIGDVARSSTQQTLFRSAPFAYMWDDHDFGPNNSAGNAPCKRVAISSYRRLIPHYSTAFGGEDDPISQSFEAGRVRYVLTDLRSQKVRPTYDPNNACVRLTAGTNFGSEAHLQWFFDELLAAKREGQVVAWVSGIPWINAPGGPNYECGEDDDWGGYPEERTRIARFIQENDIPLFMLSGDAHMVAFDDGTNVEGGFPVFHAAPLDRRGSYKGGPYSHGYSAVSGQYGWITIVDAGGDSLRVDFSASNLQGNPVMNADGNAIQSSVVFKIN